MAVRGTIAKSKVEQVIQSAFGKDFLFVTDKKIYVQAEENGEMVPVAITLTCPKTPVSASSKPLDFGQGLNFEDNNVVIPQRQSTTEISQEERDTINKLMEKLNL